MKQIKVDVITSMEELDGLKAHTLDYVNWGEYPYHPEVSFRIGHTSEHLFIKFEVVEKHIKGIWLNSNEAVWEDSCVEFFVKKEDEDHYFNFETNCIGTGLAAKRISRTEAEHFDAQAMAKVIRIGSLPHEAIDKKNNTEPWTMILGVPFSLIGCDKVPECLKVNFYKCGDCTEEPHFVSWNQIKVEQPNFHLPEFFGELLF